MIPIPIPIPAKNGIITPLDCHFQIFPGKPEYELMQTAWRERNPEARIRAAKEAIEKNGECATAYILGRRIV